MTAPSDPAHDGVPVLAVANVYDELTPLVESLTTVVGKFDVTTDEDRALQLLERPGPRIVALAFVSLDMSLVFYLRALKRVSSEHALEWQTILFCDRTEARRAYDLCREGVIDDYLVTRPLYDAWQLAVAVKHARERLTLKHWVRDVTAESTERKSLQKCVDDLEAAASDESPHNSRLQRALADVRLAMSDLSGQLQQGARLVEPSDATSEAMARLNASSAASMTSDADAASSADTVLLIDDDEFTRMMVCRTLEAGGYRVITAEDGVAGLAALDRQAVHLVLMDVEMPGLSGIETTRRIRDRWPAHTLPIIMLTGHAEKQTVLDALAAGASDFIVKPGTRAALLGKVEQHLAAIR